MSTSKHAAASALAASKKPVGIHGIMARARAAKRTKQAPPTSTTVGKPASPSAVQQTPKGAMKKVTSVNPMPFASPSMTPTVHIHIG